jgi:ABC-type transporter Mla maintaining outer membrane lipid asymmetry permease subunit MlaE
VYNLLAKTLVPGLFTAGICIIEGLSVRYSITEVPQAATRAVVRSIAALFIISAIVSVLTYI